MSGSHDKLPKLFWVQLALAAIVFILFLTADKPSKPAHASTSAGETPPVKEVVKKAAMTLAPVGKVAVKDKAAATSGGGKSGDVVYKETCGVCHNTGVAGAPKLDDKASWETRLAGGFAELVSSSINGKGGMPPRGGNPAISDSEMELAVSHMIKKAGIELVAKSSSTMQKAVTSTTASAKEEKAPEPETPKMVEAPAAPAAPAAPKTAAPVAAAAIATNEAPAAPKSPAAPEPKTAAAEAPKAPAATTTTEAPKEPVAAAAPKTPEPAAAVAKTEAPAVDLVKGEKVYNAACFACHAAGVAGSPKLGDIPAWTARIAAGMDSMYTAAIKGKGVMPPKGGNLSLSDEDVKAAVDYMAAKSK